MPQIPFSNNNGGLFYMVKVSDELYIADRPCINLISYNWILNNIMNNVIDCGNAGYQLTLLSYSDFQTYVTGSNDISLWNGLSYPIDRSDIEYYYDWVVRLELLQNMKTIGNYDLTTFDTNNHFREATYHHTNYKNFHPINQGADVSIYTNYYGS